MKIFLLLSLAALFPGALFQTNRPHIIVIFSDDTGWNDFSYQGSDQIKTPNIDALAYSGVILHRHYVLPSCTPSRAALLTGTYPIRTGMQGFPLKGGENRSLPLSFKLKPESLKDLGYKTHMIGKWHLGYETYNHVPNHRGFDTFFGYYNGFIDYYRYDYNQSLTSTTSTGNDFRGYDLHLNDGVFYTENHVYATKLFTQRAREVIRRHNASEPLYLYFSHVATHTGNDEPMGMQMSENANVNETYPHIKHYGRRSFAGCLEELDKSVGDVMQVLAEKKMLDNAIIVVMSDNGAHSVSVDMPPNWSSNWPLAGTKFTLYEGGVRGAALVWSPLLPKGFINHGFMHIADWLPTLYSAAGGNVKDLGEIDGVDQWDALQRLTTVKRENILLNIDDRAGAEGIIIQNRWKIVKGGFKGYANYDLHWGQEENVAPNPPYNATSVMFSAAGNAIQSLPEYQKVLTRGRMSELREKATVKCDVPDHGLVHRHGFIDESSKFRCPDFCVFDVLNDPCELIDVKNQDIIEIGKKFLEEYKKKMVPQRTSSVDPMADPSGFGGVWMPWSTSTCARSFAKEFTSQYLSVSLFITTSWYLLR